MIKPAKVMRDKYGMWHHPDLPEWEEGTDDSVIEEWLLDNQGNFYTVRFSHDATEELLNSWYDSGCDDCSAWKPECTEKNSFLTSIHNTANGPVASFFVPYTYDLCIYHKSCADGYGAAVVVKKHSMDNNYQCQFKAATYGDEPPNVTGLNVIIVDFSYPRETLIKMNEEAKSLLVLDHHKTAEENLSGLPYCVFNMERSGAMLAWNLFHPDKEPPLLIQFIQDRDLWQWRLHGSKEFSAALQMLSFNFGQWLDLLNDHHCRDLVETGKWIWGYQQNLIDNACDPKKITIVTVCGYLVPMTNTTVLISEICGRLSEGNPFAITYFDSGHKRIYSLRSQESGIDVSKIAQHFGGGGHKHAAGFDAPLNHRFD